VLCSARANPGCLDTLSSFRDNFERPILEGQKFDCTKRQLAQGRRSKPLKYDIDYCCTTCIHVCFGICRAVRVGGADEGLCVTQDESTHCFATTQERCILYTCNQFNVPYQVLKMHACICEAAGRGRGEG